MDDQNTTTSDPTKRFRHRSGRTPRIAVVTMGVKLGRETRGYTRFRFLCDLLCREGYETELITSSFQHWDKAQRNVDDPAYGDYPFKVTFIPEPGYKKNLDLARIRSHAKAARNLKVYFEGRFAADERAYDLIYAEIPPNDVARVCAETARDFGIPFVADINDLWPEAMRMAVDIPVLSDIAFYPFARDAGVVYRLLDGAVGTSDEYAARPESDREEPYLRRTVYVGNDVAAFDAAVKANRAAVEATKPEGEVWATYTGTLGASYDLATLIEAAALLKSRREEAQSLREAPGALGTPGTPKAPDGDGIFAPPVRVKILGDGPDRPSLEALAARIEAPVDFLGYTPYEEMAAWLAASDIAVNSLVADAPQSIVTKIGDYLASECPIVNTGSSPEFRAKVAEDGFGVNVAAGDAQALADELASLARNPSLRKIMGAKGRAIAEEQFDQPRSYKVITDLIGSLL